MNARHFPFLRGYAVKQAAFVVVVLLLCAYGGTVHAAVAVSAGYEPGFWTGFADGLLSLLKFLASPVTDVTIFDGDAVSRLYDVGYFLGVMTFTGAAGVAATSTEAEMSQSHWK